MLGKCVANYKGSPTSSQTTWTLVHKRLQIGRELSPTFRKFCIPLYCQALLMEIRKRNSTKLCQTVDCKSCKQTAIEKLGLSLPKKLGAKTFYICSVFRRLRDLMANIWWTKHDMDNRTRALESTKGLLRCLKISWTFVHKRLKTGLHFLPPSLFCFVSVHRTPCIQH